MRSRTIGLGMLLLPGLVAGLVTVAAAGPLDRLRWLEGTWKRDGAGGATYEAWQVLSAQTFEGRSWREGPEGQRQALESLRLCEMDGEVFYLAKVPHNAYPVPFELTTLEDGRAVFENPDHDFPRRIGYERQPDGGLRAWIEGPGDAGPRRIEFTFRRVE
jgi:hypothetical protein